MKIDETAMPVPGPTRILPAAALAASYGGDDDDDEEDLEGDIVPQNETGELSNYSGAGLGVRQNKS